MLSKMQRLNTDVLELQTDEDGQRMIIFDYKLGADVAILFDDLTPSNVATKASLLERILNSQGEGFRKWLAQYVVMKQASVELNSHSLINELLQDVRDKNLDAYIKNETLRNIKLLLNRTMDQNGANERQLLKNLGHWLGIITINRDRPILFEDLDILSLLAKAFQKGPKETLYILPFIVNVIMSSPKSKVFTPSSAWIRQIINIIAQIHREFDTVSRKAMENIMCKETSTPELRRQNPSSIYNHQAAADNEMRNVASLQRENVSALPEPELPEPQYYYHDIDIREAIEHQLTMPDTSQLFQMFPTLGQQCRNAIAKTVMENLNLMVERLITYSLPTTSELIKNDFRCCTDANQFKIAACQMMRSVTCAIAMTHIREPLSNAILDSARSAFNLQLRSFVQATSDDSFLPLVHQAMKDVLKKNLEFCWCYVVKIACEKGIIEVQKQLNLLMELHKDETASEIPPEILAVINKLPPEFRPRDRKMTEDEMKVYDIFKMQLPGFKQPYIENIAENYTGHSSVAAPNPQPVSMMESTERKIFERWVEHCAQNTACGISVYYYISLLHEHGIEITEDNILKQLQAYLDLCTGFCYRVLFKIRHLQLASDSRSRCYTIIDAYSSMICLLIKNAEKIKDTNSIQLFHRFLNLFTTSLIADHDSSDYIFDGLPFLRIFITLIQELCRADVGDFGQLSRLNKVEAFGHALYYVQPKRVAGFAFQWLEIIGHRVLMSEFLGSGSRLSHSIYIELFVAQLKFLSPILQQDDVPKSVQTLYHGTLRLVLLILHDFPEILCEYYSVLCDIIPSNCIQLRNMVLSAYPQNMRLPDPFAHDFSIVDSLPDMTAIPNIRCEDFNLIPTGLREQLDCYAGRWNDNFLVNFSVGLRNDENRYNVPLLNAFVIYVGFRGVTEIKESNRRITISNIAQSPHLDIFENLVLSLCPEGRYLLFSAFCNQLRYPNAVTHYFACLILYFFKESLDDFIREQITQVFFERMTSLRPYPWGLLLTFKELLCNDGYKFWSYSYLNALPEIKQLLISIAKPAFPMLLKTLEDVDLDVEEL